MHNKTLLNKYITLLYSVEYSHYITLYRRIVNIRNTCISKIKNFLETQSYSVKFIRSIHDHNEISQYQESNMTGLCKRLSASHLCIKLFLSSCLIKLLKQMGKPVIMEEKQHTD